MLLPRFDAGTALRVPAEEGVTFFAGVPTMYWGLLQVLDDTAYPITARIDGTTATQVAESFTPRDAQALGVFAQRAALGAAVSVVLGAVLGAGVGCLVGAAAGAVISSPVIALLVPFVGATVAGCVLGMAHRRRGRLDGRDRAGRRPHHVVRSELAQHLVTNHRHTLTEIAELLGFSAPGNFSRWFRRRHGCSPGQWRARAAGVHTFRDVALTDAKRRAAAGTRLPAGPADFD